mmetsp:Transcript_51638/g.136417  ORF Transcript_51638/g.136417 Transcript_51638/m.136417 type:complete len:276 (+) Transcript_51638:541-1368(+)
MDRARNRRVGCLGTSMGGGTPDCRTFAGGASHECPTSAESTAKAKTGRVPLSSRGGQQKTAGKGRRLKTVAPGLVRRDSAATAHARIQTCAEFSAAIRCLGAEVGEVRAKQLGILHRLRCGNPLAASWHDSLRNLELRQRPGEKIKIEKSFAALASRQVACRNAEDPCQSANTGAGKGESRCSVGPGRKEQGIGRRLHFASCVAFSALCCSSLDAACGLQVLLKVAASWRAHGGAPFFHVLWSSQFVPGARCQPRCVRRRAEESIPQTGSTVASG